MERVVRTKNGPVKGVIKKSLLDDQYYSFQGIPYAKPPVGDLRFKAPVPCDTWEDVMDATKEKPIPFGLMEQAPGLEQSEDCLYLNVYSKNITPDKKMPVMVYIYGGEFRSGSSTSKMLGPDYLMQRDVVLVTFNYRIGPLGFLTLDDPSVNVPGNAGLKDQLLVLKWVKDNISEFGGDPENITVFGNSAGAVSTSHHTLCEKSKGLFNRAIVMSGSAFCFWGIAQKTNMTERLARATGFTGSSDDKEIYNHLKTVDPLLLTKQSVKLTTLEDFLKDIELTFSPSIEPYRNDSTFFDENLTLNRTNVWSKDMDMMITIASNEGIVATQFPILPIFYDKNNYIAVIPYAPRVNNPNMNFEEKNEQIRAAYNFESLSETHKEPFLHFYGDRLVLHGVHRHILYRTTFPNSKGKTFVYRFNYTYPTMNYPKSKSGPEYPGACHGDDLCYIFSNVFVPVPAKGSKEWNAMQKMVDLFVGFATNGSAYMKTIGFDHVKPEDLPDKYKSMEIDEEWKMSSWPEMNRIIAFDSVYPELK